MVNGCSSPKAFPGASTCYRKLKVIPVYEVHCPGLIGVYTLLTVFKGAQVWSHVPRCESQIRAQGVEHSLFSRRWQSALSYSNRIGSPTGKKGSVTIGG